MAIRSITKVIKSWWDGPHISQVEPNLFIGDLQSSHKTELLAENSIGAILSVYRKRLDAWDAEQLRALIPESRHKFVQCLDSPQQDLLSHLNSMCDFIDEQHRDGKRVLVHCNAGESRSVAVVTAYLVRRDGIKLETALDMVRKGRKTAQPNFGFMEQLEIWEEVGYEVWMDGMVPKRPYQQFLQERAMDPR